MAKKKTKTKTKTKPRERYHLNENSTIESLTSELTDDLRDAWERLRDTGEGMGEQRIYASHNSIMFSRKTCHFFVRPRTTSLEVVFFLDQPLKHPMIKRADRVSKKKVAHKVLIKHSDEIEPPFTDWLAAAYELSA